MHRPLTLEEVPEWAGVGCTSVRQGRLRDDWLNSDRMTGNKITQNMIGWIWKRSVLWLLTGPNYIFRWKRTVGQEQQWRTNLCSALSSYWAKNFNYCNNLLSTEFDQLKNPRWPSLSWQNWIWHICQVWKRAKLLSLLVDVTISGTPCSRHITLPRPEQSHLLSWGLLSQWHRQKTTIMLTVDYIIQFQY